MELYWNSGIPSIIYQEKNKNMKGMIYFNLEFIGKR